MGTEEKEVEAEKSLHLILCFHPSWQSGLFLLTSWCEMQGNVSLCRGQILTRGGFCSLKF